MKRREFITLLGQRGFAGWAATRARMPDWSVTALAALGPIDVSVSTEREYSKDTCPRSSRQRLNW
jgi:hypothetical protein